MEIINIDEGHIHSNKVIESIFCSGHSTFGCGAANRLEVKTDTSIILADSFKVGVTIVVERILGESVGNGIDLEPRYSVRLLYVYIVEATYKHCEMVGYVHGAQILDSKISSLPSDDASRYRFRELGLYDIVRQRVYRC